MPDYKETKSPPWKAVLKQTCEIMFDVLLAISKTHKQTQSSEDTHKKTTPSPFYFIWISRQTTIRTERGMHDVKAKMKVSGQLKPLQGTLNYDTLCLS